MEAHRLNAADAGKDESSSWSAAASDDHPTAVSSADPLILITPLEIALSTLPLLLIALISFHLQIQFEQKLLIAMTRNFVQLSILGFLLVPLFQYGESYPGLVLLYATLMVVLSANEITKRIQYQYPGIYWNMMGVIGINVLWVCALTFGVILQPQPLWDPHYVIPILGMLLGNSITGVSLALNAILNSLVECTHQVELYQSYGATPLEASRRLIISAIQTGTLPIINGMSIMGLISIPGMMTGQILGGSPVLQAARYQILIMYCIASCSFGTIFMEVYIAVRVCFHGHSGMLQLHKLYKRKKKEWNWNDWFQRNSFTAAASSEERLPLSASFQKMASSDSFPKGISIQTSVPSGTDTQKEPEVIFEASSLSHEIVESSSAAPGRTLFDSIDLSASSGQVVWVNGPSGSGKSTLLKSIAQLQELARGEMRLNNEDSGNYSAYGWRRNVRYVAQSKNDLPGTPLEFLEKIATLSVWKKSSSAPSLQVMIAKTIELLQEWGLGREHLETSTWKTLSGGESQRVALAIALASQPRVLLLDECTSALDQATKLLVEQTLLKYCEEHGIILIMITHEVDQMERMGKVTGGASSSSSWLQNVLSPGKTR